jgi:hypothetical protein
MTGLLREVREGHCWDTQSQIAFAVPTEYTHEIPGCDGYTVHGTVPNCSQQSGIFRSAIALSCTNPHGLAIRVGRQTRTLCCRQALRRRLTEEYRQELFEVSSEPDL